MPKIKNMGTATMSFKEGIIVSGSTAQKDGSYTNYAVVVSGSQLIDAEGGNHGLTIFKEEADRAFIRFINSDDPTSWYAYIAFDSAENFYIAPGRSQDFFLITRTGVSGDPNKFPFRVYDSGKVKFDHSESNSSSASADLPADVVFHVSGSNSGTEGVSVFGGNVVVSGSLSMTGSSGLTSLNVYGNTAGSYVATIDNDQNTNGHVLKLSTDGNGSGSRILEMEDGDGDIVFRARADGRFGFGPDGVSSMGAGTFVVGIDNSSHTADIAISQRLQHLGDSDTYLDFPSNDNITFAAGGSEELKIASDAILVKQYIKHAGDQNTWINFSDNRIRLNAGGNNFLDCQDESSAPHKVRINNGGNNIDFVIKDNSGNVYFTADASTSRIGIGAASPIAALDVSGSIAITSESSTPSQPADGQGYLYSKSDGKLYWRSYDVSEVDLTAAGGGGGSGDNLSLTALKTSNYTAANWEMVLVNLVGASSDVTITLPAASSNKQVAVKIAGLAMGKQVIVDGNSSETIDGSATKTMNTDYESMHLISDGSNWWRIS